MTSLSIMAPLIAGCTIMSCTAASASPAEEASAATVAEIALADLGTSAPLASASPFDKTGPVEEGALSTVTGMANLQQYASANNTSVVAGNSVNGHSITGEISIDGQSFQNLNGLSILTANTGNNVSINAAMNVNVSFQQ